MRCTRKGTRRASSTASTRGSSFSARPPPEDGLTSRTSGGARRRVRDPASASPPSANPKRPRRRATRRSCRRPARSAASGLEAARAQSRAPGAGRAGRRRSAVALGRGEDQVAAGAQDAGELRRRRARVEHRDQVEVVVGIGDAARPADLEGDPALGVEPDPAARRGDQARRRRRSRAPARVGNSRARKSAPSPSPQATCRTRSGPADVEDRGGQRGQRRRAPTSRSIVIALLFRTDGRGTVRQTLVHPGRFRPPGDRDRRDHPGLAQRRQRATRAARAPPRARNGKRQGRRREEGEGALHEGRTAEAARREPAEAEDDDEEGRKGHRGRRNQLRHLRHRTRDHRSADDRQLLRLPRPKKASTTN